MKPSNDSLERLAVADPLPDAERLTAADRREADALLERLLAQPVERPRRVPGWRPLAAVGVAAGVLALALGGARLFDDGAPGPDVVDLAVAAVTDPDAIFHTVQLSRMRDVGDSPGPSPEAAYVEAWYGPDGSVHEKYFEVRDGRRGPLRGESAGRLRPRGNGRLGGPVEIYNASDDTILRTRFGRVPMRGRPALDPTSDPGARLRELERGGDLRLAGTVRVDGRKAYRLVSGDAPGFGPGAVLRYEYLVDAETYYPLVERLESRMGREASEITTRYLVYERLPFDRKGRRLLDLDPHPGARVLRGPR